VLSPPSLNIQTLVHRGRDMRVEGCALTGQYFHEQICLSTLAVLARDLQDITNSAVLLEH